MKTEYNRNPVLLKIAQMLTYYEGVDADYDYKCRMAYEAGDWDIDDKDAVLNKIKDELMTMGLDNLTLEDWYRRANMIDAWFSRSVNFYLYKQKNLDKVSSIIDEFMTLHFEESEVMEQYPNYPARRKYVMLIKTLITEGVEKGRLMFDGLKGDTVMDGHAVRESWYVEDCWVAIQAFESWQKAK